MLVENLKISKSSVKNSKIVKNLVGQKCQKFKNSQNIRICQIIKKCQNVKTSSIKISFKTPKVVKKSKSVSKCRSHDV